MVPTHKTTRSTSPEDHNVNQFLSFSETEYRPGSTVNYSNSAQYYMLITVTGQESLC